MKISYAILTHNEHEYIDKLLATILSQKDKEDEVVVVDDYSDAPTSTILQKYANEGKISLYTHALNENFAQQKNYLIDCCTGDWIFNIDADELPHWILSRDVKKIITSNKDIDAYFLPRVNTVSGMTDADVVRWRWSVNPKGWINWPDWQLRLFKRSSQIRWMRAVHEQLQGYSRYGYLPDKEEYALLHHKDIKRQNIQNELYQKIQYQ